MKENKRSLKERRIRSSCYRIGCCARISRYRLRCYWIHCSCYRRSCSRMPCFEVQMRWKNRLCTVPMGRYNSKRRVRKHIHWCPRICSYCSRIGSFRFRKEESVALRHPVESALRAGRKDQRRREMGFMPSKKEHPASCDKKNCILIEGAFSLFDGNEKYLKRREMRQRGNW